MQPLFAMFFSGPWELIIVALIILLLFGNRLPALMRSMGKSVVEFKKGVNEIEDDSKKTAESAEKESE